MHSGWCPCPVTASAPRPSAPRPARPLRSRLRAAFGPPQTGQSCWMSGYQIKSARNGGVLRCIGTPSISGSPLTAPSAGTAALCIISEREPASRSLRRSLAQAGFRNWKIIIIIKKHPTRPPKSRWKRTLRFSSKIPQAAWPPPPASPRSVSNPFDLPLPGWCTSRVEETLLLQLWLFFPLLPPPPASLPLPLHPWRAGRRGGRGHPGILIHSHCRNGRDVAFRRQARPSAKPPTGQQAEDLGRSEGPSAPREAGRPGRRAGPHGAGRGLTGLPPPAARGARSRPGYKYCG